MRLLLLLLVIAPLPAIDIVTAARDLASQIAAKTGPGPIALEVRAPGEDDAAAVRGRLAAELRPLRIRTAANSSKTVRVTLSESLRNAVWTAEILAGGARDIVWIERPKDDVQPQPGPRFSLERTLLIEQTVPILDVATLPNGIAVLEPESIAIYETGRPPQRHAFNLPHQPSRDLRGRLIATPEGLRAWLPGIVCDNAVCRRAETAWPLDGAAAPLAPGRNYFNGPNGQFYSSATVDDQNERLTLYAALDGRTALRTPVAGDIAGAACGGKRHLLAINGASIESFRISNRHAAPAADPVEFFGPLTALWPQGDAVIAIARNHATGNYAAYRLALVCTP